jgi:serine/threonine protein kinase
VAVRSDVATALEDLDGRVVHRDLKPENVLFLDGRWSLADFGISRYAESTTAPDTRKYAMTPPYAAPEQWRWERATGATDIYALGVMAYEMLVGTRPFPGPGDQYRQQHLHVVPARVQNVSVSLAALVAECLQKQPETRPTATEVVRRLRATAGSPRRPSLARLQQAHEAEVSQLASSQGQAAVASSAQERRELLFADTLNSFATIADGSGTRLSRLRRRLSEQKKRASVGDSSSVRPGCA